MENIIQLILDGVKTVLTAISTFFSLKKTKGNNRESCLSKKEPPITNNINFGQQIIGGQNNAINNMQGVQNNSDALSPNSQFEQSFSYWYAELFLTILLFVPPVIVLIVPTCFSMNNLAWSYPFSLVFSSFICVSVFVYSIRKVSSIRNIRHYLLRLFSYIVLLILLVPILVAFFDSPLYNLRELDTIFTNGLSEILKNQKTISVLLFYLMVFIFYNFMVGVHTLYSMISIRMKQHLEFKLSWIFWMFLIIVTFCLLFYLTGINR